MSDKQKRPRKNWRGDRYWDDEDVKFPRKYTRRKRNKRWYDGAMYD